MLVPAYVQGVPVAQCPESCVQCDGDPVGVDLEGQVVIVAVVLPLAVVENKEVTLRVPGIPHDDELRLGEVHGCRCGGRDVERHGGDRLRGELMPDGTNEVAPVEELSHFLEHTDKALASPRIVEGRIDPHRGVCQDKELDVLFQPPQIGVLQRRVVLEILEHHHIAVEHREHVLCIARRSLDVSPVVFDVVLEVLNHGLSPPVQPGIRLAELRIDQCRVGERHGGVGLPVVWVKRGLCQALIQPPGGSQDDLQQPLVGLR